MTINRRNFLKNTALTGSALGLGFYFAGTETVFAKVGQVKELELNPYILIDTAGKITLMNPRPDMGQGTYQSMAMLLAEELEVNINEVHILMTDGKQKYGSQLSGGSSSVRVHWEPLRKAGATARTLLIRAAAQTWQVSEDDCYASNAKVYHKPSGKSLAYSELVEKAEKLEIPKEVKIKDKKDFKIVGKSMPRQDIPMKVDGSAIFGMDVKVPGMLYASIERPNAIIGKIASLDDSAAKAIAGVKQVIKSSRFVFMQKAETVAVIASNYYAALQGRKALKVTWDCGEHAKFNSQDYFAKMKSIASQEGIKHEEKGNFAEALKTAGQTLTADYETPFLAHASMETECCVVSMATDPQAPIQCEIWAPVQGADWLLNDLNRALQIPPEKVKIHVTFLGGAFGRKAFYDFIVEAALLSKQMQAPIKLIWTREDDITQGPFRPAMLSRMSGGLDKNGNIVAFEHKIVGGSIQNQWGGLQAGKADEWAMEAVSPEKDSPYAIPNYKISYAHAETKVPLLWWRSVYSSTNAFGHESFIDELAHLGKKDPMNYRIELFKDAPRFQAVLKLLAEKSKWNEKLPKNKARGVAIARSFESICAHVVEVEKTKDGIKINKVTSVIDCGMYVNPDTVRGQTEGNIIMGLTAAIKDGITFENGVAQQRNFDTYRVLRLQETPEIEVHIIENNEHPGGVGEPGLPPVAPALTNAVFALTGKRIRKLPFALDEV
jgi:isoquinoline 1-oxidoreductase subunit beta